MAKLELDVAVKLDAFRQELASMPNVAAKVAEGMTDALNTELRKQTVAVRTANKQHAALLKQEVKARQEASSAIEKAGDKLTGGMVGDLKDYGAAIASMGKFAGPAALAIGALAVGTTAYATAITAAITGTIALTRAAGEAAGRIESLDGALTLRSGAADAIEEANGALDAMAAATDPLVVLLADELAPAVTKTADTVAKLSLALTDAWSGIGRVSDSAAGWNLVIQALAPNLAATISAVTNLDKATSGYDERLANLKTEIKNNSEEEQKAAKEREKAEHKMWEMLEKGTAARKKYEHERTEAAKKAADEAKKLRDKEASDLDALWSVINRNQESQLSGAALIRVQAQNQIEDIERIAAAHQGSLDVEMMAADARVAVSEATQAKIEKLNLDAWLAESALLDEAAERRDDERKKEADKAAEQAELLKEITRSIYDSAIANVGHWADVVTQYNEQHLAQLEMTAANEQEQLDELLEYKKKHYAQMTEAEKKSLDAQIALQRQATNEKNKQVDRQERKVKQAAMVAFFANKAASFGQSVINTALGVTAALTIPPPAGLALATTVGVMGAVSSAAILAEPPPAFHTGGMPNGGDGAGDEFSATLRRGEYVVSPRGVAAAGGPANLDALNSGAAPAGATTLHATLMLGDREIALLKAEITGGRNGRQRDIGYANQRSNRDG